MNADRRLSSAVMMDAHCRSIKLHCTAQPSAASLVDTCRIDTSDDDASSSILNVALTLQLSAREPVETRCDGCFEYRKPECRGCSVHCSLPILLCSHETWPLTKLIRHCITNRESNAFCAWVGVPSQ